MAIDLQNFADGNFPTVFMVAAGLMAFIIVYFYRKDEEGKMYKFSMFIGFFLGIGLMVVGRTHMHDWSLFDAGLVILAGFILFIRPLKNFSFAVLVAVLAMVLAFTYLKGLTGDLEGLSHGWPRIIITLIAGAFVFVIFNFLESLTKLVGKLLNYWPILLLLGFVCVLEGTLLLAGAPTLLSFYDRWCSSD